MQWLDFIPEPLNMMLRKLPATLFERLEEVRVREQRPLEINAGSEHYFVTEDGRITHEEPEAYKPGREDTHRLLDLISNHSLYTLEEELRKGFITLPGGHRVGLAGRTVLGGGRVEHLRDINSFNIRIARAVPGVADRILPYLLDTKTKRVLHTLIISPPQQGKTTLLRDLARQLSQGWKSRKGGVPMGMKVGIIDERSEIAGSYKGLPGFDVGPRTDVLDGCPKAEGMMMMIRSMSPDVLIVDEIGRPEDADAVREALYAGISVIASVHGRDLAEVAARPGLASVTTQQIFQMYVQLERTSRGVSFRIADAKQRMMTIAESPSGGRGYG
ncbi:stage III sporulation protein AA [Paenibacillus massiliensis]|uniref:stage III sporulation protein AA n=1 Tax=Paenibacillus massiliensis TaxID=225917 RepID=UPI0012B5FDAC|nr:stage III sporulation protein AA [Paenibacillus massiliensis]